MNKPSRVPFYSIIVGLILLGLGTAWLRHTTMEIPFLAGEQRPRHPQQHRRAEAGDGHEHGARGRRASSRLCREHPTP